MVPQETAQTIRRIMRAALTALSISDLRTLHHSINRARPFCLPRQQAKMVRPHFTGNFCLFIRNSKHSFRSQNVLDRSIKMKNDIRSKTQLENKITVQFSRIGNDKFFRFTQKILHQIADIPNTRRMTMWSPKGERAASLDSDRRPP